MRTVNLDQLLDLDDPVDSIVPELREPDFRDTDRLTGKVTAIWIGPDAAVEVDFKWLADLPYTVDRSGRLARAGELPSDYGITVAAYNDSYTHPAEPSTGHPAYRAWRLFTDTLTVEED